MSVLLQYPPDFVHVMMAGKLVKSGGPDLALHLEEHGYDWVREKIKFEDNQGKTVKTTLATLSDGVGDCDEMSSLFIALCRAAGFAYVAIDAEGYRTGSLNEVLPGE